MEKFLVYLSRLSLGVSFSLYFFWLVIGSEKISRLNIFFAVSFFMLVFIISGACVDRIRFKKTKEFIKTGQPQ